MTAAGPELKGAVNVVIPRIDDCETSYSGAAFEATYRFITGNAPQVTTIAAEMQVELNGKVTGLGVDPADAKTGNFSNNLPLAGAQLEVYATNPVTGARTGNALLRKTVEAHGRWGPLAVPTGSPIEFVITAPSYATTHIYRSASLAAAASFTCAQNAWPTLTKARSPS